MASKAKAYLLVKISSYNEKNEEAMEKMLHSLHRLLPQNGELSLEFAASSQYLNFYFVADPMAISLISSQLYAEFPHAEVEQSAEYLPTDQQNMSFAEVKFQNVSTSSFKTYKALEESFLKALSAVITKSDPADKLFIQFALKKVGSKIYERGLKGVRYSIFFGGSQKLYQDDLYMGKFRVAYESENKQTAAYKVKTLLNLLKNVKGTNELKRKKFFIPKDIAKRFYDRATIHGDFWTCEELATLYHFPYQGMFTSSVVQTQSKKAPAPDILPIQGAIDPNEVSFIGKTNYQNEGKVFGLKRFDRRRHLYVIGKTGSGKSKLLELLLQADIQSGQGCCLIDPHGDLAHEVMGYIPKERIQDVIYIDPTDRDFPVGFNPLEPVEDYEMRQHISIFFIAIFKKLFAAHWNARMEHLIRYITLALLETSDSNVLGISRILGDTAYRQRVIKQIQDPVVKSFWINDFKPSDQLYATEAIIPLMNKIGQFVANPMIRNIIGQKKNMLQFDEFMNTGKIVIVNLSKGKIGEENTALLGSMFITKIQQAALARSALPEEQRRDFYFYVDEFQNFATDAFSSILSEARKYRLNLTIAHQYIAQLPDDVKATALGNVASIVSFAIGGDDAAYLSKEFSPVFTPDDMIGLNAREMYIKMTIDGKVTPPFSARTLDIVRPEFTFRDEIINISRMKYSQSRAAVEAEIARWTDSSTAIDVKEDKSNFPEPLI